jgi:hypothetical protein
MNIILHGQFADPSLIQDKQVATADVLDGTHRGHQLQIVTSKPVGGKYFKKVVCNCGQNLTQSPLTVISADLPKEK